MDHDWLVTEFYDMLGFYGKDEDEARVIIANARNEGFSEKEIREAYKEARKEYIE